MTVEMISGIFVILSALVSVLTAVIKINRAIVMLEEAVRRLDVIAQKQDEINASVESRLDRCERDLLSKKLWMQVLTEPEDRKGRN